MYKCIELNGENEDFLMSVESNVTARKELASSRRSVGV
jgi:hypothetical protein